MIKHNNIFTFILLLFCAMFSLLPEASSSITYQCDEAVKVSIRDKAVQEAKKVKSDIIGQYSSIKSKYTNLKNACTNDDIKGCDYRLNDEVNLLSAKFGIDLGTDFALVGCQWNNVDISKNSVKEKLDTTDSKEIKINLEVCEDLKNGLKTHSKNFSNALNEYIKYLRIANANEGTSSCCPEQLGSIVGPYNSGDIIEKVDSDSDCLTFGEYQKELGEDCPLCPIFEVILKTDAKLASIAWDKTAAPLQGVVIAFGLALLAFEVLKIISSMGGVKISELVKNLLVIGFKISLIWLLLSNPKYIYSYFINPLLTDGLTMGTAIAGSDGIECTLGGDSSFATVQSDTLSGNLLSTASESIKCFNQSAAQMPAMGRGLMCYAWETFPPKIGMWISGILFYLLGLAVWLVISFYLIDCTVQIGMCCALVPLFIACWPFKFTQEYSIKGVHMLLNSFFTYAVMGVIVLLGAKIISAPLTSNTEYTPNDIADAFNSNDWIEIYKIADVSGLQLLLLIASFVFAFKLVGTVSSLAGQFESGSGSSIGAKLGGAAVSAATAVGMGAASLAGGAAKGGANALYQGSSLQKAINKDVNAVKGAYAGGLRKLGGMVGLKKFQNNQTGSGKEETAKSDNKTDNNVDDKKKEGGDKKENGNNEGTKQNETS